MRTVLSRVVMMVKDIVCKTLTRGESLLGVEPPMATVLTYHSISNCKTIVDVSPKAFRSQIEFLKSRFNFITLDEVVDYIEGRVGLSGPSVAITFDDGYANILRYAFPVLSREKIRATMFVLAQPTRANRSELENGKGLMSWQEVRRLRAAAGWTIGCHGATHANLGSEGTDCQREIVKSKVLLEKRLQAPVEYLAYPKGVHNLRLVKLARKAGYKAAFTSGPGLISTKNDLFEIPRVGVDQSHSLAEFEAFFTRWGAGYLVVKDKKRMIL